MVPGAHLERQIMEVIDRVAAAGEKRADIVGSHNPPHRSM